jgi:Flp pilus assembly pilin Flp
MQRRVGDRGVTAVEYALVVGLVVVTLLGAVEKLEQGVGDEYDDSVSDVEDLPGSGGEIDPDAIGASSSSTTTPPTSTTVDTGPSSTTSSSTTSTSTTTTLVPTSTTLAPRSTIIGVTDVSTRQGSRKWDASATVQVAHNQTAAPVSAAVVTVTFYAANGATTTVTCTTSSAGSCDVTWNNRTAVHAPMLATVTSVAATPTWDQVEVSAQLAQP